MTLQEAIESVAAGANWDEANSVLAGRGIVAVIEAAADKVLREIEEEHLLRPVFAEKLSAHNMALGRRELADSLRGIGTTIATIYEKRAKEAREEMR